ASRAAVLGGSTCTSWRPRWRVGRLSPLVTGTWRRPRRHSGLRRKQAGGRAPPTSSQATAGRRSPPQLAALREVTDEILEWWTTGGAGASSICLHSEFCILNYSDG